MIIPCVTRSVRSNAIFAHGRSQVGESRARPVRRLLLALPLLGGAMLQGCISVKAPDKPIVIELNINIKQEVVYRLAQDANATIESNPEIF